MFRLRAGQDPELSPNASTTRLCADSPISPLEKDFELSDAASYRSVPSVRKQDALQTNVRTISNDTFTEPGSATTPGKGHEMGLLMESGHVPQANESDKVVQWGVQWYKEPTYMILFAILGLGLAIGHHGYYLSMDGRLAGSNTKQQWAHNFGNLFAIAVVAALHAANGLAYSQYVWLVVRGNPFTVEALDNLFSLTSNPYGFFHWEVWRGAPLAVLLALTCWIMALAGVLPPGTLIVVPGTIDLQSVVSLDSLNFNQSGWVPDDGSDSFNYNLWTKPTPLVLGIASQTAQRMDIQPFTAPAPNSSYSMEIRGPYLQCGEPNITQQAVFEYYQTALLDNDILTAWSEPKANNSFSYENMADFSAFAPWLGSDGWTSMFSSPLQSTGQKQDPDVYNNWHVQIPADYSVGYATNFTHIDARQVSQDSNETVSTGTASTASTAVSTTQSVTSAYQVIPQQLFVQTIDKNIVCTLGNGTRDVHFNFTSGVQNIWYSELKDFEPLFVPQSGYIPGGWPFDAYTYMSVFVSLTSMLSGNVTTRLQPAGSKVEMVDSSSRVLLTGLSACEEFTNNSWTQHPPFADLGDEDSGIETPIGFWQKPFTNDLFTKPAWMCRNRTLARAIEDLATNITISMLSQSQLTTPNTTAAMVSLYPTLNVYRYNPVYLLLSYGVALLFTIIGISLGMFAFHSNGVIHSTSFSAIVATTRNRAFDNLSKGHSLGTFPVSEGMKKTRLRFGGMRGSISGNGAFGIGEKDPRAGFGIAEGVVKLRKGGRYV